MYCYVINPIDIGWELLLTVDEARQRIGLCTTGPRIGIEDFEKLLAKSRKVSSSKFGASLLREGNEPRVFMVPVPHEFRMALGFVWKYYENGATFVSSEQKLNGPLFMNTSAYSAL